MITSTVFIFPTKTKNYQDLYILAVLQQRPLSGQSIGVELGIRSAVKIINVINEFFSLKIKALTNDNNKRSA